MKTQLIQYRREFHKYAENCWDEIRTSARVAEILMQIGIDQILMGEEVVDASILKFPTVLPEDRRKANMSRAIDQGAKPQLVEYTHGYPGVIGIIDTGRPGPTYALRFDMDCLPYTEYAEPGFRPVDEGYVSINPEGVHACGHDAHTAIGLGLAKAIKDNINAYCGKIKLIFQPAEEGNLGAKSIVAKGHLDDVDTFLAVHLALSAENVPLPSHTIACGCRDFLSNRRLYVTFHGRAAHPCGASQEGKNALLAACSAALNLHAIAPHEKGLGRINVGEIEGGLCTNTICPECTIRLEYRGQTPEIAEYFGKRVFDILDGTAKTYDMPYTVVDFDEVPTAQSDESLMRVVADKAEEIPWFEKIYFDGNLGGTDDAAAMMAKVQEHGGKATYIGIGCDITEPLHNPRFDFDEDCLEPTVELLTKIMRED